MQALCPNEKMTNPRIRSLDGIRVIAEYFVVRHHVLMGKDGWAMGDPVGLDILSLFFVLSGFVTMWMAHEEDLTSWSNRREFLKQRIGPFIPIFLLNWAICLPDHVIAIVQRGCWVDAVCPLLQLGALDCWFGCGYRFIMNSPSWFLSTLVWLWAVWVCIKDWLLRWFGDDSMGWERIYQMGLFWLWFPILMFQLDMYTTSPFPPARLGEYLVGCGVASALLVNKDKPPPFWLQKGRFWLPVVFVIVLYNLQTLKHGLKMVCLEELAQHDQCKVWSWPQPVVEAAGIPPCLTGLDKIVNKYALVWAGLIYGVARTELLGEEGGSWTMRVLQAEIFQFLSVFSVTLYLSHINMANLWKSVAWLLFGWEHKDWGDDTLLFCTYVGCYWLHHGGKAALVRFRQWRTEQETNTTTVAYEAVEPAPVLEIKL